MAEGLRALRLPLAASPGSAFGLTAAALYLAFIGLPFLWSAAGGFEASVVALALSRQVVPPTINLEQPSEDCDLDFVPAEAREVKLETVLTNSFGFGGTNGALVMTRF